MGHKVLLYTHYKPRNWDHFDLSHRWSELWGSTVHTLQTSRLRPLWSAPQVVSIVRFYCTHTTDLTIETTLTGPTGGLDCEVLLYIHYRPHNWDYFDLSHRWSRLWGSTVHTLQTSQLRPLWSVPQVVSIVRFYCTYTTNLTIETTLTGPTGGLDCEVGLSTLASLMVNGSS